MADVFSCRPVRLLVDLFVVESLGTLQSVRPETVIRVPHYLGNLAVFDNTGSVERLWTSVVWSTGFARCESPMHANAGIHPSVSGSLPDTTRPAPYSNWAKPHALGT